jgi:hypothetical protein
MMAKMFYTLEEAKAALGKNEEDIKQLTREGRLREFRDGPRLMFKADQVEQLKGELGGASSSGNLDQVDLGPSDSGAPIGMVDSRQASGSGISIALSDADASAGGSGLSMQMKDDTALAQDLGLSGSVGGMPSPGRVSGSLSNSGISGSLGGSMGGSLGGSLSGSAAPGRGGVSVFSADDSIEHADPAAQTNIAPGLSDQVNLEGVGSGSGLLDLTRESDDTSLGAELLDEIAPGAAKKRPRGVTDSGASPGELDAPRRGVTAPTVQVEAFDPGATAIGGLALGAAIFTLISGLVLAAAVLGTRPKIIDLFAGPPTENRSIWIIFGIGVVLVIITGLFGLLAGRSAAPKR